MQIYINDVAYDIPCSYELDWEYFDAYYHLIRLKNGKIFLHVRAYSDNDDDPYQSIYQFTGTKMKNVLKLYKPVEKYGFHIYTDVTKVKDNTITVKQKTQVPKIGYIEFYYKYKYSNGKWALTSNVANISKCLFNTKYETMKKTINWYTSKECTKKKSTSLKKMRKQNQCIFRYD